MNKFLADFVGTFILVFGGVGSTVLAGAILAAVVYRVVNAGSSVIDSAQSAVEREAQAE